MYRDLQRWFASLYFILRLYWKVFSFKNDKKHYWEDQASGPKKSWFPEPNHIFVTTVPVKKLLYLSQFCSQFITVLQVFEKMTVCRYVKNSSFESPDCSWMCKSDFKVLHENKGEILQWLHADSLMFVCWWRRPAAGDNTERYDGI